MMQCFALRPHAERSVRAPTYPFVPVTVVRLADGRRLKRFDFLTEQRGRVAAIVKVSLGRSRSAFADCALDYEPPDRAATIGGCWRSDAAPPPGSRASRLFSRSLVR